MAKLLCCALLALCLVVCNVKAIGLPGLGDVTLPLGLDCLLGCPCPGPCVPKLGLDPLIGLKCVDASLNLNISCPSLALNVDVCCALGASCYTSCGTSKTVCDIAINACLLTLAVDVDLCKAIGVNVDLGLISADITLCARYRDAQKYGCGCGSGSSNGGGGSTNSPVTLPGGLGRK